jgi:hypothetical protein
VDVNERLWSFWAAGVFSLVPQSIVEACQSCSRYFFDSQDDHRVGGQAPTVPVFPEKPEQTVCSM